MTGDVGPGDEGAEGTLGHPDLQPALAGGFVATDMDALNRAGIAAVQAALDSTVEGPFLDDGTLLKPVAVDTTVPDGSVSSRPTASSPATRSQPSRIASTSRR